MQFKYFFLLVFFALYFPKSYCQNNFDNCESKKLGVFLTDPDTSGTNIREKPNGKVKYVLKNDPSPSVELYQMFEVCRMQGNWLFVKTTNNPVEIEGWIHNSVVSATLAAYSEPIPVYEEARDSSKEMDKVSVEQYVKILEAIGIYSKIEYKDEKGKLRTGYVKNYNLCGNPYTTCG